MGGMTGGKGGQGTLAQPGWNFEQPWSLPQSTDQNWDWSKLQNLKTGDLQMLQRGLQMIDPKILQQLLKSYDPNEIYGSQPWNNPPQSRKT